MTTKAAVADGPSKQDAKYVGRIDKCLMEIKSIQEKTAQKRIAGRETVRRIDRNLKEIDAILERVEATL